MSSTAGPDGPRRPRRDPRAPRRDGGPGLRAYRRLLRLLPRDMRERFARDMEDVLRVRLEETDGSPWKGAVVWLRAMSDVVTQSIVVRFEEGGGNMGIGTWLQDVRFALAGLRATPGVTITAVLTLALGIGASAATFSLVHGVILEDLPFDDPDRLVFVWPEVNANKAMTLMAADRMSSLEAVSGMSGWSLTLTGNGEPRELNALQVSPGYFDILRARPELGRAFAPDEDLPGRAGEVILSHDLWESVFGADPGIIDRVIDLGGADYDARRVIGVMPPGTESFWNDVDVWVPLEGDPALSLQADQSWYVNQRLARLAPGATLERANAEVVEYAAAVQHELPNQISAEEAQVASVRRVHEYQTADVRGSLWTAFGTVGLVLLIGCLNVTNLLLARGDRRRQDLAVRAALGASGGRLSRMLLTEAGVLGLTGGALGVGLSFALVRLVVDRAPATFPGIGSVSVDPVVLGFAAAATMTATLVAGLVPSLRLGRVDAVAAVGGGARGAAGRDAGRITPLLVGGQIALAVVVTVGSGLMVRSLTALLAVDPGLSGQGVLTFQPSPPSGRYPDGEAFRAYYRDVSDRVAALPSVEAVGGIHLLPGTINNWGFPTYPEGYAPEPGAPTPNVNFRAVRGDYFEITRIPVTNGRALDDDDRADTEPVVIVNQAFVATYWPGEDPLGKTLSIFSATGTKYRVVGVVADVRQHLRSMEPSPEMYFSHAQVPWNGMPMWILAKLRPGVRPEDQVAAVQEAVWSVDGDVPITGMAQLSDVLDESTRTTRLLTAVLSGFGLLALALSTVGVFSVAAYTGGRRRPEFGVRLALGSSRASIVRSAVTRSLAPVVAGLALGLVGARLASAGLASALFGVTPSDPVTFVGVALLLGLTATTASVVPAWRASRVDPVTVLGAE